MSPTYLPEERPVRGLLAVWLLALATRLGGEEFMDWLVETILEQAGVLDEDE